MDTSISGLVATLAPALIVALLYVSIFLALRCSHRRFYAPRTYLGNLRDYELSPELPKGLLCWFGEFWKIPDTYVLHHHSFDSYLFLRYLRVLIAICFIGCLITWPVLLPVNVTGGNQGTGLNMLAFGNVNGTVSSGKNRMFAHVFIGWIFFGFIQLMICRETIVYVNLRQALLLSPNYANRISSRTVLFTSVPDAYLHEVELRKTFGDSIKNVWITRDTTEIDKVVHERDKIAMKLEGAETNLIKLANKERLKAVSRGDGLEALLFSREIPRQEKLLTVAAAESGSVAARWLPSKKRPTHRTGMFGFFGAKVDSIDWCRERLKTLIGDTDAARAKYHGGGFPAQGAYQTLSHHQALHMSPRYIGMHPDEIVWSSLGVSKWQKLVRRYTVQAVITALIIFWTIPVAGVGLISNIPQLAKISWLTWLNNIPTHIIGVVSGLLPSVLLSITMALVPIIIRVLARISGEPTLARVELFTQNAYFFFQVVQVFLVVTLGSAASSVAEQLAHNPSSITNLLAQKLPLASNFYISYFILQGLTVSSGVVSQVIGFCIFSLLYRYVAPTPRSMYVRCTSLSAISWGSVVPVFSNIAVIAVTYSLIAPLVLGFAAVGIALCYIAYRYNVLYVTNNTIDTKGLMYPRALQHLLAGVYLGEICMIGLFSISTAIGPIILMVLALIGTIFFHIAMNSAFSPLLYNLPKSLETEPEPESLTENGTSAQTSGTALAGQIEKPNLLRKFLMPHIYADYATLRHLVQHNAVEETSICSPEVERDAYLPPSVKSTVPLLWIPHDQMGISCQEIAHTKNVIPITDEDAALDAKGNVCWVAEGDEGLGLPPIWVNKACFQIH